MRRKELAAACKHFSGRVIGSLGLPDGTAAEHNSEAASRLRRLVISVKPDVVILPWLLDQHPDHRAANLIWAMGCSDLRCIVLGTELWSLCIPNAYFDITAVLSAKLDAIREFSTQLATVDYVALADGLAKVRAFHGSIQARRTGAAEAFFSLPNKEYCELVLGLNRSLDSGAGYPASCPG